MTIKGIDHITINVKDMEKTQHFYRDLLGFKPLPSVDMGDHVLSYFALPDGTKLELVEYRYDTRNEPFQSTDKGNARHLAFVVDDVYALEKKLTEAGYPFHCPVSAVEKLGFTGGLMREPNGFELEFLQYNEPAPQ